MLRPKHTAPEPVAQQLANSVARSTHPPESSELLNFFLYNLGKSCFSVSAEMYWALASLPSSTRSWSWRPSRPSEPRSSKCTAAVCRSNEQSTRPASPCCCRTPTAYVQMDDGVEKGRNESERERTRALPNRRKDEQIFLPTALLYLLPVPTLPHAFLDPLLPFFFYESIQRWARASLSRLRRGDSRGVTSHGAPVFFCDLHICT